MADVGELLLPEGAWATWGEGEYSLAQCPNSYCRREFRFTYNTIKNEGRCFVCGYVVKGLKRLLWLAEQSDQFIGEVEYKPRNVTAPKLDTAQLINAWDHNKSRDYLISKGVNELTCRKCKILYLPKQHQLYLETAPITEDFPKSYLWRKIPNGKWFHKKGTRGIYYGWGWEKFKNSGKNILITEGVFDLFATKLYDYGIAVLGSNLNDVWCYWLKENCSKVLIWMDPDDAGIKASKHIAKRCEYYSIDYRIITSTKDPKCYNRLIPSDCRFLEDIERELRCD